MSPMLRVACVLGFVAACRPVDDPERVATPMPMPEPVCDCECDCPEATTEQADAVIDDGSGSGLPDPAAFEEAEIQARIAAAGLSEEEVADLSFQASMAGVSLLEVLPAPVDEPVQDEALAIPAEEAPEVATWAPGTPIPGSWGVRLLNTLPEAQPPRAVLGFSDGAEVVVQPGTMIPYAGVVVLAIGRDAVQIAEITPMGDRTRIDTQTLQALYPARSGGMPAAEGSWEP